ncbi:RNA-binding protein [Paenibacillus puerhi]|uniref:RNA-binding protein n=1 Tax=Paenibacillus puerhi TaxID=2692622 RepID=UPI001357A278|nr:RNA-binding protein [Paenibacillus puerhi]
MLLEAEQWQHPDVQLPDIQFVTYCFEHYGLNRGIYNTVDEWLYEFGIRDIINRRRLIVEFLESLQGTERTRGTYLKFGKGGLTKQLSDFIAGQAEQQEKR